MSRLDEFIKRKQIEYGSRFDSSKLLAVDQVIIDAFNRGYRVKVKDSRFDDEANGLIGITTGWIPCFLLMHSTVATGSSRTITAHDKVIAVKFEGDRAYRSLVK